MAHKWLQWVMHSKLHVTSAWSTINKLWILCSCKVLNSQNCISFKASLQSNTTNSYCQGCRVGETGLLTFLPQAVLSWSNNILVILRLKLFISHHHLVSKQPCHTHRQSLSAILMLSFLELILASSLTVTFQWNNTSSKHVRLHTSDA